MKQHKMKMKGSCWLFKIKKKGSCWLCQKILLNIEYIYLVHPPLERIHNPYDVVAVLPLMDKAGLFPRFIHRVLLVISSSVLHRPHDAVWTINTTKFLQQPLVIQSEGIWIVGWDGSVCQHPDPVIGILRSNILPMFVICSTCRVTSFKQIYQFLLSFFCYSMHVKCGGCLNNVIMVKVQFNHTRISFAVFFRMIMLVDVEVYSGSNSVFLINDI